VIDIPLTICFTMMLISGFAWVFHKDTICEWAFEDFENSYHASLGSAIIIGWGLSFFCSLYSWTKWSISISRPCLRFY